MRLACALLLIASTATLLAAQVPGEVRGRVTDARTARPVAEAQVEVVGRTEIVRSEGSGEFVVRGLEPRDYTIRVRAIGYRPREMHAEVSNGRFASLEVALDPSMVTLGGVVVKGRGDSLASQQAFTYDRAAIEQSGRRDLGELLQETPGVVVTQAGGAGQETRVSIRGSAPNQVLVLLDGVPLNSSLYGVADLSRVSLESVERVTVLTGAQSARYGPRAMAGVIEIETRRPSGEQSALLRTGAWGERELSANASDVRRVGSREIAGALTGDYRYVRGDFPFELPALRGGGMTTRTNSDVSAGQLLGSFSLGDSAGGERVRGSWDDLSRGLAGSIIQPSATGREGNTRASGGGDVRRRFGAVSWTALADVNHERATFVDPAPPFGTPYNDTVSATGVEASSSASVGGAMSNAMLGAELRTLDVHATELAAGSPHFQRLLGAFGAYHASRFIERARTVLSADVSARVDNSSLDHGSAFSPKIGASASRGVFVLSGSIGNGYSPPTLADQFFQEGVLVRANPNLRPERTKGDLEARLAMHDASVGAFIVSGSAALFRADIDGMILWMPDFQFIWSPSNFDVHRRGYELSGGTSLPAWHVALNGTLNHTDVTYAGPVLDGQVAYRPVTTANLVASFTPRAGRFEVIDRYVGERRTVPGSSLNTLDPYWRTDARWTSPITRGRVSFETTIGVENVFDRPAAMLVDYPFPGRTWTISLRVRHLPSH